MTRAELFAVRVVRGNGSPRWPVGSYVHWRTAPSGSFGPAFDGYRPASRADGATFFTERADAVRVVAEMRERYGLGCRVARFKEMAR